MKLIIEVDIDVEESGLEEDEIKDDIINFTRDFLIIGAEKLDISFALKEISYSN